MFEVLKLDVLVCKGQQRCFSSVETKTYLHEGFDPCDAFGAVSRLAVQTSGRRHMDSHSITVRKTYGVSLTRDSEERRLTLPETKC